MKKILFTILFCLLFVSCKTPPKVESAVEAVEAVELNNSINIDTPEEAQSFYRYKFSILEEIDKVERETVQSNKTFFLIFNLINGLVYSEDFEKIGYLNGVDDSFLYFVIDDNDKYKIEYKLLNTNGVFVGEYVYKSTNSIFKVERGFIELLD